MSVNEKVLTRTVERFRERRILLPTFAQMLDPTRVPEKIKRRLHDVGLWDVDPVNLFRITWKNAPPQVGEGGHRGGLYNDGNWIEFPPALTGVEARIVGLVGNFFPTGAHKVGAAFGCLVPKLVSGEFDPTQHKAVWPSTGNYCRGGAFDSALVGCTAVAILPEEMSRERFAWLKEIGAEVISTPGCESNVKEIYDKCWEIRRTRPDCVIFNQFEEFGNAVWHYHVTGKTIEEIFERLGGDDASVPSPSPSLQRRRSNSEPFPGPSLKGRSNSGLRLAGYVSATGSAGTIAAGDYLRSVHPHVRVVATEALQCPTLYQLGFGGHRIEGIGDKHVPWIHNVRNTDMVAAIDDGQCMALLRLFNEPEGQTLLNRSVSDEVIQQLPQVGISGICNLVAAIKTAKYYDMDERDVVFTCLTDSAGMYASRLEELAGERGVYSAEQAAYDRARYLDGIVTDHVRELTYFDRKALHNFKYFTWVEQQGRTADELRELWEPEFWDRTFAQVSEWDEQIEAFNDRTGVLELL